LLAQPQHHAGDGFAVDVAVHNIFLGRLLRRRKVWRDKIRRMEARMLIGRGRNSGVSLFADRSWRSPDGLELHARDYAAAPGKARLPVICIHGLTRNARDFEDLAPRLAAQGRRVLAVDVRGRGGSAWDPTPENYQHAVYAPDIADLMSSLGLSRAVFIGTSMGGMITMALASTKSDLVAAAVLNDIGPEAGPAGMARIAAYAGRPAEAKSWRGAAAYVRKLNGAAFPHYGPRDWMKFARRVFREGPQGKPVLDYDPEIAVPIRAGAGKRPATVWPLWRRLAGKRPVLVLRGETSDILLPKTVARMRRTAPKAAFAEVPGVGHAPMLDEPAALEALMGFLAGLP
jgi:pimeloyl-ACP methyl ester carboxylesterase